METKDEIPVIPTKGKLCLNMIVKNESRIIERLLSSVLSIIDTYCITDTGSTDDTPTIIREFMKKHNKPGTVIIEPFKNFGYNRTFALEKAAVWGEYALLLDADMKLIIKPEFSKDELKDDGYLLIQGNPDMKYYNTRIVKTGIGVKCVSPTHEYYNFPPGTKQSKLYSLYIDDIGDGGCKADKFERDIRLLKQGLEEEPRNGRYHFYIANSYKNIGKFDEAIEWYRKRVEIGGWHEEVFYSLYEMGNSYQALNQMEKAVYYWMEAWDKYPRRAESLYEIVKYFRIISKHNLAQHFCNLGKSIPFPKDDVLFIKHNIYEYMFDYEHSILAYYTKAPINHHTYLKLIGTQYSKDNVLSNYQFYVKKIKDFSKQFVSFNDTCEKEIQGTKDTFVSSSPCIIVNPKNKDEYILNIRYVNYTIRHDGTYAFRLQDGKIRTLNKLVYLNSNLKETKSHWFDNVHNPDLRYQGVEDVKLFKHKDEILFSGTIEGKDCLRIGYGKCDTSKDLLLPKELNSPFGRGCEKNWVFCNALNGDLRVVYEWCPLTIAEMSKEGNDLINLQKDSEVPDFFRDIRGSTNGCKVNDETWFLCHLVHYTNPRKYYHIIVILDKNLKYKKHSILFKFEGVDIEYALGFIVNTKELVFSYSTMDRTSAVLKLTRQKAEEELF
jgi:tetratricopeptide (TPR) repeat protein